MILPNDISKYAPIGVFDSGLGGLTIVEALQREMPSENIIYYGDNLHLPYGGQTKDNLLRFIRKILLFLKNKRVKLIFIACNSATSAIYPFFKNKDSFFILNVIDPFVNQLSELAARNSWFNIGLIGTEFTIKSGIFSSLLGSDNLLVHSLATPKLVPLIENFDDSTLVLNDYLVHLPKIDVLALGCTHYPWIKKNFENFYQNKIPILDATNASIKQIKNVLSENNLLNYSNCLGKVEFYWSKLTFRIKNFVDKLPINTKLLVEKVL